MDTQRQLALALLQQAGPLGVNSYDLTFKYKIKQAPTRICELRAAGYQIKSRRQSNRSVTYVLLNSQASTVTTEPQKIVQSWEKQYESYVKDGRTFWREV